MMDWFIAGMGFIGGIGLGILIGLISEIRKEMIGLRWEIRSVADNLKGALLNPQKELKWRTLPREEKK
jgi:hypothetical protein